VAEVKCNSIHQRAAWQAVTLATDI